MKRSLRQAARKVPAITWQEVAGSPPTCEHCGAPIPVMALRPDSRFPDELDDVVVERVTTFRAEAMDDDDFWLACYFANGERIAFRMTIGKKPKRLVLKATEMPPTWRDLDAADQSESREDWRREGG